MLRYDAEAFGGLSRATFVEALKSEGIPCQLGYLRPMHHADLFADKDGELSRVWPRVGEKPAAQYSTVDCPHAERACADEMITLPTNVLLDSTEGMEQILSAIEKIQAGQHGLEDYSV